MNKVHKIICGMCNQTAGIFRSWLSGAKLKEVQPFIAIIFLVKYYARDEPQNTGKKHNGTEHPLRSVCKNFVSSVVKKIVLLFYLKNGSTVFPNDRGRVKGHTL